jgi:hypothetical protein
LTPIIAALLSLFDLRLTEVFDLARLDP